MRRGEISTTNVVSDPPPSATSKLGNEYADAYTNLGIDSKNEWGIKPSMFSSKDVLAEGKGRS